MKEIITKVYQYSELSDAAKKQACDWYREASLHDEWWEQTYEDANNIGVKITGFDVGRGNSIEGKLENGIIETCELIMDGEYRHGECCDTYKLAAEALPKVQELIAHTEELEAAEEEDTAGLCVAEEALEEMTAEFERAILEEYLSNLRKEFEYIYEDEQVAENIEANEYTFTEDGKRFG